ncbi:MAG: hypothetical protein SFX72_17895 [Isosphaeraceae bacterium]|nr:hypothetical protein [Isosphaeraceae bacterium]
MALNPLRQSLQDAGMRAFDAGDGFKPVADAAIDDFRAARADLERKVRNGELTLRTARSKAVEIAGRLAGELARRADERKTAHRPFFDRLVATIDHRRKVRASQPIEQLQRETNRMIAKLLVEQQLQNRSREFEAKTYVRSVIGGDPAPTLDNLLAFHEAASDAGDEAAREWARRKLEEFRPHTLDPEAQAKIDSACDRPDAINPRITRRYLDAIRDRSPETLEEFVAEAVRTKDANACAAAYLAARAGDEGLRPRWVRVLLDSLGEFPDAALEALRKLEAETASEEAQAARTHADFALRKIEAEARLADLQPPTPEEIRRQERLAGLAPAAPGEAIGLALGRRGMLPEDFETESTPTLEFEGEGSNEFTQF